MSYRILAKSKYGIIGAFIIPIISIICLPLSFLHFREIKKKKDESDNSIKIIL